MDIGYEAFLKLYYTCIPYSSLVRWRNTRTTISIQILVKLFPNSYPYFKNLKLIQSIRSRICIGLKYAPVISAVQILHAYVDMIVMALLELRQELYNESAVCESTLNPETRPFPLAPLSIVEDNADDKVKSPASVSGSKSHVNTITKFATDIVRLEQRLALVFFSASHAYKCNGLCSTLNSHKVIIYLVGILF